MELRFNVGDYLWRARYDSEQAWVTCPDCGGDGRLRVIFHDGEEASIECSACAPGYYERPTGCIKVYERKPIADRVLVTGLEVNGDSVTYRSQQGEGWSWIIEDEKAFATEEEALAHAAELAAEADREEREKIARKEKDTRSWGWNASYHRREIREAQKRIEYHAAKLAVASLKAKEKSNG